MESTNSDLKLVSMKLTGSTISKIENIKNIINEDNRTQIVATSINLLNQLLIDIQNGGKVYIEKKDGTKEIIRFIGI